MKFHCPSKRALSGGGVNASIVVGLVDEIKDHRRGFKPFAPVIDGPNTVRFRQSVN
jgi:hypothetical protein